MSRDFLFMFKIHEWLIILVLRQSNEEAVNMAQVIIEKHYLYPKTKKFI